MPKNSFADWDTTASNNTDIDGIDIQGTAAVQNFDNALRTLMAQLKSGVSGLTLDNTFSGANTFTATQTWAKGADVASATALTLGTDGNYFDITGTTSITSITTIGAGTVVKLHFDGILTLTHHATDLILPGGANITTAAGDEAEFVEYAAGDWRCVSYQRANTAPALIPQGQCYLNLTGGVLLLSRRDGNQLTINGQNYTIPDGLTLTASGLSAGTFYYIYAFMNSGTMTLEASTTGYTINATTGIPQKTGDATRTLVGAWIATAATTWSTSECAGASWFNPLVKSAIGAVATTTTTSETTLAELSTNARLDFVTFAGRAIHLEVFGWAGVSVATSEAFASPGLDGASTMTNAIRMRNDDTTGNLRQAFGAGQWFKTTDGKHYVTPFAAVTSGTGTFGVTYVQATILG